MIDLLFHPVLWSLPFLALIGLNSYQIMLYGVIDAKLPFVAHRSYTSFNVILFSFLFLWSLMNLSKFKSYLRIYLTFVVLFACYGSGEIFHKLMWSTVEIELYGLFTWISTLMYPLFFAFNNIPLKVFLKDWKKTFFGLLFVSILLYGLFYYVWSFYWILEHPIPYGESAYRTSATTLYYLARTFSVLAYAYLIKKSSLIEVDV